MLPNLPPQEEEEEEAEEEEEEEETLEKRAVVVVVVVHGDERPGQEARRSPAGSGQVKSPCRRHSSACKWIVAAAMRL